MKKKKIVKLKLEDKRKKNNKLKLDYNVKNVKQNLIVETNYLSIFKKQGMQLINDNFLFLCFNFFKLINDNLLFLLKCFKFFWIFFISINFSILFNLLKMDINLLSIIKLKIL